MSLSIRHFVPMIFLLSLILPLALMIVDVRFGLIAATSACAYLLLTLFVSLRKEKRSKSLKVQYLFKAFTVLHLSYGFGSLVGLFTFPQKQK